MTFKTINENIELILFNIAKSFLLILCVAGCVAFTTLIERIVLRLCGNRIGPNKVSIKGILQPLADALKLLKKSRNSILNFSKIFYYLVGATILIIALIAWTTRELDNFIVSWKFSLLVIIFVLRVLTIKSILAGWRTYRKYSLIGAIRTVSQLISYERVIYLVLLRVIWFSKRFKLNNATNQNYRTILIIIIPLIIVWVSCILAELRRTPYDFSEGERELVRGFNIEFGRSSFTILFLSEYSNILFFSALTSLLFFKAKILMFCRILFWIIWIRRTAPRIRFDKFMSIAWKIYIPFTTLILILLSLN